MGVGCSYVFTSQRRCTLRGILGLPRSQSMDKILVFFALLLMHNDRNLSELCLDQNSGIL